jgi:hypothetical protein
MDILYNSRNCDVISIRNFRALRFLNGSALNFKNYYEKNCERTEKELRKNCERTEKELRKN